MKYYFFVFLIVIFTACKKESSTFYQSYFVNKSGHIIEIRPYFSGIVPTANILQMGINDTLQIADGFDRGIEYENNGFDSKYFAGSDSIKIIFDNLYSIIHYVNTPAILAPKYYLYTSLRNIGNYKAYRQDIASSSKYSISKKFWFVFTEQDYLDTQ